MQEIVIKGSSPLLSLWVGITGMIVTSSGYRALGNREIIIKCSPSNRNRDAVKTRYQGNEFCIILQ
jgi:hypothetical protein